LLTHHLLAMRLAAGVVDMAYGGEAGGSDLLDQSGPKSASTKAGNHSTLLSILLGILPSIDS
jgi:hypothetical protein